MKLELIPATEIKRIRKSLGLTTRQFAAIMGVTREVIKNWERGRTIPRADKFLAAQQLAKNIKKRSGGFADAVSEGFEPTMDGRTC